MSAKYAKWRNIVKGHRPKGKIYSAGAAAILLAVVPLSGMTYNMATAAAAGTSGALRSKGAVRYEQAFIDASDLHSIHAYITEKRNAAADILLQLGTKFRNEEGKIVYDRNPDAVQGDVDLSRLSWAVITQAVAESQNVPGGLTVLNPEAAMHIEGVEEHTDYYVTATADNISRGKAAWADGRLLLGNGADNDKAYQAGIHDGENGHIPESLYPVFSVQEADVAITHVHIGSPEQTEGVSGCYQNSKETKVQEHKCGAALEKTAVTWYPNPDEPEGGSWHGGYYTCPAHGGTYDSPGKCTHKSTVTTTVWHNDIICGLTDAVYARLAIRGTDTDYADRAVRLEAVLEQGDAYEQLVWQNEEQLVWTDENGNTLGTGPELTVQAPGTYQCSINVANEDIDHRSAGAVVRVSGFVLRN